VTISLAIWSCASSPKEAFSESFFTYQDESGKKYFSFILKLDNIHRPTEINPDLLIDNRRSGGNDKRQRKSQQGIPRPENPEDAQVSLRFRMEEMAHQKFAVKLADSNYCPNDYQLETDEYERYRYKIKGFCI